VLLLAIVVCRHCAGTLHTAPPVPGLDRWLDNGRVQPFILQNVSELSAQRPPGGQENVHFSESLATAVIEEYSATGDLVLDPFAGFGTTLVVAERLGRRAIGVELLLERSCQIEGRTSSDAAVVTGDARNLLDLIAEHHSPVLGPPRVDLCLTSPPYMTANNHPENPLEAYETATGHYPTYLTELEDVFRQVSELLRPGGHAVINVANTVEAGVMTPLAWDLARVVSRHLRLLQECYICWDRQPPGISGDYCLVFQRIRPTAVWV